MSRLATSHVLVLLGFVVAVNYALTLPKDLSFETEESIAKDYDPSSYMLPPNLGGQTRQEEIFHAKIERPRNCFHFFVARNMSSLLSDATKMLRQVRDRREREWLLTFIYRIKSLAEHIRSHPDSQNYDCLPIDTLKHQLPLDDQQIFQQPDMYFVDDVPAFRNRKRALPPHNGGQNDLSGHSSNQEKVGAASMMSEDNQDTEQQKQQATADEDVSKNVASVVSEPHHEEENSSNEAKQSDTPSETNHENESVDDDDAIAQSKDHDDNVIVVSSAPGCEVIPECDDSKMMRGLTSDDSDSDDDSLVHRLPPHKQPLYEDERTQHEALKERIKKALLEEMAPEIKKLRTVGGSSEDLMNLWKLSEGEDHKVATFSQESDFDYEENGAAAGDLEDHERAPPTYRTVAPSQREVKNSKHYEPYDDSDVLVKQLFEVQFNELPSKTTKSIGDQNNEYLITSTHIPY